MIAARAETKNEPSPWGGFRLTDKFNAGITKLEIEITTSLSFTTKLEMEVCREKVR